MFVSNLAIVKIILQKMRRVSEREVTDIRCTNGRREACSLNFYIGGIYSFDITWM